MINELYGLSTAIKSAGLQTTSWDRKYKPIPNIKNNSPCVRIELCNGEVVRISAVEPELGAKLRKYGTNQGSYPCMNLAPLFRIEDKETKTKLEALKKRQTESLDEGIISEINTWCIQNNWGRKFQSKYKISMVNEANELSSRVPHYHPLQVLLSETCYFEDSEVLHKKLQHTAFTLLKNKEQIQLALQLLFYPGNSEKNAVDDYGTLSVAFESKKLIDDGTPAVSLKFVEGLNNALQEPDTADISEDTGLFDAFGKTFVPLEEPMPEVKLAGGFDVKLRSMFKEQRCQMRYGRIEDRSYPLSQQMRKSLQSALSWVGQKEKRDINWINLEKNEILFAYPSRLPQTPVAFTQLFGSSDNSKTFEEQSKRVLHNIKMAGSENELSSIEGIQLFVLRKIDKARTKIIYTRLTDPVELEKTSNQWITGCADNLPRFSFGQPRVPFPLNVSDVFNSFWKQDGSTVTREFKPIPRHHGIRLIMEPGDPVISDLHMLVEKGITVGPYIGNELVKNGKNLPLHKVYDLLALIGLLLYRINIRRGNYMENLPYLYGQLLKVSDELHALYCKVVRKGDYPTQFVGSSLFQSAVEAPVRTLNILAQRISPYYSWAKSYRLKDVEKAGEESWRARWLYSQYENIMVKLHDKWTVQTRFNDEEKAQFFIGYLASFPKKESLKDNNMEGDNYEQ